MLAQVEGGGDESEIKWMEKKKSEQMGAGFDGGGGESENMGRGGGGKISV